MRIFSIIAAIAVAAALYFAIVDRGALLALFGQDASAEDTDDSQDTGAEENAAASDLVKVVVQKSIAQEIDTAVSLRGETRAARVVDVKSETSATVVSEPLRKGENVDEGQLLCRLDESTRGTALAQANAQLNEARARAPEAKARLDQAIAQLAEARINENASTKLSAGGFASTTRVANAEANVATALASVESARAGVQAAQAGIEGAQAGVATAEKELERLMIRAPFSGILESDTAELGTLLQAGDLCATVIQLNPVKLVAFVPETEVARVKVGASARATLATGQDNITGQVTFLSRAADETTRTFLVEIEVANTGMNISDGQTAEIMVAGEGATAHLLPQSALTLNDDGVLGIRSIDENAIVEFHAVQLLRDTAQGVWLTGLADSVNVIVLGQEYVIAGVRVAPTYRDLVQ
ncbi:efflux RND transporter periplasmic adaptor subunit [Roseobacter sp. OBYS 0001]|uniref:efflux RND transporter periplasmic adaptor subunit n=1 Tax=Roseobacter sp. OBYS 0001 TaxID=882651 RepID=UPI001BBE4915|nr:efflux RND transporter periplasmic adaptor subunit [Roseobacter sp. OBYS 0001]GIT86923.1 hemolysin D [Roseobacter sp. OBYS 0001]